jgi:hypothetical protein
MERRKKRSKLHGMSCVEHVSIKSKRKTRFNNSVLHTRSRRARKNKLVCDQFFLKHLLICKTKLFVLLNFFFFLRNLNITIFSNYCQIKKKLAKF